MLKAEVGGNTGAIADGGAALETRSSNVDKAVTSLKSALTSASGAVGHASLASAIDRGRAAWSTEAADLATGLHAAATLAKNAAKDLETAGGE